MTETITPITSDTNSTQAPTPAPTKSPVTIDQPLGPGYVFSKFTQAEHEIAESRFADWYLARAARAGEILDEREATILMKSALDDVLMGRLNYPQPAYFASALSRHALPFLMVLALRQRHPAAAMDNVRPLITPRTELALSIAVLQCIGAPVSTIINKQ